MHWPFLHLQTLHMQIDREGWPAGPPPESVLQARTYLPQIRSDRLTITCEIGHIYNGV